MQLIKPSSVQKQFCTLKASNSETNFYDQIDILNEIKSTPKFTTKAHILYNKI